MSKAMQQGILALDAGGTKCDAALIDMDGRLVGWGTSNIPGVGGRNYSAIHHAAAQAMVCEKYDSLVVVAQGPALPLDTFASLGAAPCRILVCREATAAYAHVGLTDGVVLLAGTGAFAHGRTRAGRSAHLDGTGPILGDFGGGYHIGLMVLNACVRSAWHPRHATSMSEPVLRHFKVKTPYHLFNLNLFSQDRSTVASLAHFAIDEAQKGDPIACAIIRRAAETLAETCRDLVESLDMSRDPYAVIGTGGIIRVSDLYWDTLCERVREMAPRFQMCRLVEPPVISVAVYAFRQLFPGDSEAPVARLMEDIRRRLELPHNTVVPTLA